MARLVPSPLTRVAAACALAPVAVAVHPAAPVAAEKPALVMSCTTSTLPIEEVQAGATSEILCEWAEPGEFVGAMLSSVTVAVHYESTDGVGPALSVFGECGGSISFGAGDPWNNTIASTRHHACGNIKHFDNTNLTGDSKLTTGLLGILWPNLGTMQNRTSSVGYGA
jgi:hypothetical protein